MKSKIRVLITGSRGFVGKNLIKYLKKKKDLDIFYESKNKKDLSKKKNFIKLMYLSQPNIIIHLVSRTVSGFNSESEDKKQYKNTFMPTKNLIESTKFCKNLKKIIFTGSIEEYGNVKTPYKENFNPKPISSYGKYKLRCLKFVKRNLTKNIKFIWLRPSLMFGPSDNKKRFLGSILHGIKNKKKISVSLDKQKRDYLYVEDFNRFLYQNLIKKKFPNIQILNISNENWFSLASVLTLLKKLVKGRTDEYLNISKKKRDNTKLINSGNLLKKNYPHFKFTKFELALEKTLKSYNIK